MKYKIEIWHYCSLADFFESDDIKEVVKWYRSEWKTCYDDGNCCFEVYEYGRQLSFDEVWELGFFND